MQLVKFTFSRDQTHAGERRKSGDVITIPEIKAERLRAAGAGTFKPTDPPESTKETNEASRKRGFFSTEA